MIQKHWKYAVIAILAVIVLWQRNCIANANADAIAKKMQAEVMAKKYAKLELLTDKYRKINAKLYEKNAEIDIELENTSAKADGFANISERRRKEILKLKDFKVQAEQLNLQLIAANDFVLVLKKEYATNIDNLNLSWDKIVESKNNEICDLNESIKGVVDSNGKVIKIGYIGEIGQLTKDLVIARRRSRNRLNLGFFAGYSVGGSFAAGVGLTFDLIPIPINLF